jgi:hypothetical protein
MKKTILGIVLTMVLMSTLWVILLSSMNYKYEVELNKVKTEYENKIKEKDFQIQDYESQIYNIIEGKNYDVAIDHESVKIKYTKKNGESKLEKLLNINKESKTTYK